MNTLIKALLVSAAVALAYPVIAAGPASAPGYMQQDMTKEQYLKFAQDRFDAMDTNKDGKISTEERAANRPGRGAGPGASMPVEVTREQHMKFAEDRFNAMDANKDGKITSEERFANRYGRGFGPGAGMPAEMTREQHMQWAQERFDAMDTNKDGKISVDERQAQRQGKWAKRGGRGCGPDGRGYGMRGGWGPQASMPATK